MSNANNDSNTALCLNFSNAAESKALLPGLLEKSKEYGLNLCFNQDSELQLNESVVNGIMAFGVYDKDAAEKLAKIRENYSEQSIPAFILTPHQFITNDMQELADKSSIKIISLPISIEQLCIEVNNACLEASKGGYNIEPNLRRYSRIAVSHPAFTVVEVELVDVSIGGICFKTNTFYQKGKTDRIQFNDSELIDAVDFKVTKIETLEDEKFKFSVSACFETLQEDVLSNVSDSLIEPESFL